MKKLVYFLLLTPVIIFSSSTKFISFLYLNYFEGKPFKMIIFRDGTYKFTNDYEERINIEAYPICATTYKNGLVIGSTSPSSIIYFDGEKINKIIPFEEGMVSSVCFFKDFCYVSTNSPPRVYSVDVNDKKKLIFSLIDETINSMLILEEGLILLSTSKPARLIIIDNTGKEVKRLSLDADYARTIFKFKGKLYIGTQDPPRIYRLDEDFKPFLLLTLDGMEITKISSINDELVFILNTKKDKEKGTIFTYSEKNGLMQIFESETLFFSLFSNGKEAYIGDKNGFLYYYGEERKIGLLKKFDKSVLILEGGGKLPFAVLGGSPTIAVPFNSKANPFYLTPILDTKGLSRIGSIQSSLKKGRIYIKGGNSEISDASWGKFLTQEQILNLDLARYYQIKVELLEEGESLNSIFIGYKNVNRAPKIDKVKVHPPGEIYVKNVSQLGDRLVQEIHEKNRPFPELARSRDSDYGQQIYYLYGFRMISYEVVDPDGDEVRVKIEIKPQGGNKYFVLGENIKEKYFVFDSRSIPDGYYTLKITASDEFNNPKEEAKEDSYLIDGFLIDNSPPSIEVVEKGDEYLKLKINDKSGIKSIRASKNGGGWEYLETAEKMYGYKEGTIKLDIDKDILWLVIQVTDIFDNVATYSWVREK